MNLKLPAILLGAVVLSAAEVSAWDPASVDRPQTQFEETRRTKKQYNQYFYFHQEATNFSTALADIRECDLRARGLYDAELVYGLPKERAVDPSDTFLAGIAGPMAAGLVAAITAPVEARRERSFSLRRCMFFKGYDRYGLSKTLFERFNYAATDTELSESDRQRMLAQQALVASGPRPETAPLGL